MMHRLGAAFTMLFVAPSSLAPAISASDQAAVNLVVVESNNRFGTVAFQLIGPADPDDVVVSACLGGLDSPSALPEFDGETARVIGDQFGMFESAQSAEVAAVSVFVVDAPHARSLDWFVTLLGDSATGECRRAELSHPPGDDGPTTMVDAVAAGDLGIGDSSARLEVRTAVVSGDDVFQWTVVYVAARTGRALTLVTWVIAGPEPISEFDPEAELTRLSESLAEFDDAADDDRGVLAPD